MYKPYRPPLINKARINKYYIIIKFSALWRLRQAKHFDSIIPLFVFLQHNINLYLGTICTNPDKQGKQKSQTCASQLCQTRYLFSQIKLNSCSLLNIIVCNMYPQP